MYKPNYRSLFQRIVSAFEDEGYPHHIIGQWTLPENDVEDLIYTLSSKKPKRLLEVGTFVGLSTMLLALASDDDARIVSVDPNYPISREMLSMGSSIEGVAHERRTQEIAKAVAQRLGVFEKIIFVAGGFAVNSSFASRRNDEESDISVVGATVCEDHGPFDFVLVDGLHYADAVEQDLQLASSAMSEDGIMLAHDCIGMWGTNVRAGIKRFLLKNPDWNFSHKPYADVYRSFGTLFRRDNVPVGVDLRISPFVSEGVHQWLLPLVSNITKWLKPDRVIELFYEHNILESVHSKNLPHFDIMLDGLSRETLIDSLAVLPEDSFLLSVGALDCLNDNEVCLVLDAICRTNSNMLMISTFPGENGVACTNSRPLQRWVELANRAGLTMRNADTLSIAPSRFSFVRRAPEDRLTSALCAPLLLTSDVCKELEHQFPQIDKLNAERIEEQWLLDVHYGAAFDKILSEYAGAQSEIQRIKNDRDELSNAISQSKIAKLILRRKMSNMGI
jgi:predicted O-methyltransferase YrrM